MFIHFAFGQLGKQGKTKEQTEKVIDTILTEKRLVARNCTEFLPSLPIPGSKRIPTRQIQKVTKDDEGHDVVWFAELDLRNHKQVPYNEEITYLPQEIPMICFINISFSQLKASPHSKEYGKFGLVLNNQFLQSQGIKPVSYYSEESLWNDPEIIAWNHARYQKDQTKQRAMQSQIVAYRKPATYFPSFARLTTITISKTIDKITVDSYKYDRYQIGYDFRNEHENRIIFQRDNEYLHLKEEDLYMIIVPDIEAKNRVVTYLNHEWQQVPLVRIFPS